MISKRITVLALSVVLLFGVIAPGFAQAHEALNDSTSHLVLPFGEELTDEESAEIRGEVAPWIVGGIVAGVGYVADTYDQEKDASWYAKGAAAVAVGAITGGVGTALMGSAATTAGRVAAGVYSAVKGLIVEKVLSSGSK